MVFQERVFGLKGVSWNFQECFKKVARVYTESFKRVPMKFKRWFKEVWRAFQGGLFQECVKGVSSKI